MLIKLTRICGQLLMGLAVVIMLISYAMIWRKDGLPAIMDMLSPFNIANYIATALALAPGYGLIKLSIWLGRRAGDIK